METFETLAQGYVDLLRQSIGQKVILDYFNEYREYKSSPSPLKRIAKSEEGEFVETAFGVRIPLNRIIALNGVYFPGYEDYEEVLSARCSR